MHDQTVRLINEGYTPPEIAEMIKLPQSLSSQFGVRGYYGDVRHNVKAIYQYYIGAYDGNPAELNPLPPVESSRHYLELMGGADKVLTAAQTAYDKGEYRWVAELLNHVVLADPGNKAVIALLAKTYDQMGYQAESATWRNSYLAGASELRNGPPKTGVNRADFVELLMQTPTERFLEAMAAALNGPAADGKDYKLNLVLSDVKESYVLWIENAVLHYHKAPAANDADATLTLTKPLFVKMMAGTLGIKDAVMSDDLKVNGSKIGLVRFLSLIDKQPGTFGIVTRQPD
jgi:alkyl sulfatase BDS1-like metallo-beta-lactamase superfamily hydrolase